MAKLVKIDDRKAMEIFSGRKTMGPIEMRLDEAVIGRLLRGVDAPKNIFAVNPKNKTEKIALTIDNYLTPEADLFGAKKAADDAAAKKVEEAKNILKNLTNTEEKKVDESVAPVADDEKETKDETVITNDEIKMTADDNSNAESETDKINISEEVVKPTEDKADTVEDDTAKVNTDEIIKPVVEDNKKYAEKVDEKKDEIPKQQYNYNKNKNNKNRK